MNDDITVEYELGHRINKAIDDLYNRRPTAYFKEVTPTVHQAKSSAPATIVKPTSAPLTKDYLDEALDRVKREIIQQVGDEIQRILGDRKWTRD